MLHPEDDDESENSTDEASQTMAEGSASWHTPYEGVLDPEDSRTWEVLWKEDGGTGHLQRLTFEATAATRVLLHKQVEAWSVSLAQRCTDALSNSHALGRFLHASSRGYFQGLML